MKRKLKESREHYSHRLFMSRSSAIRRHQKERAKELNLPFDIILETLRAEVKSAIGCPCPYCCSPITAKNFSLDHLTPLSRGGDAGKYLICCNICNERKGSLTVIEYTQLVLLLNSWSLEARTDVLRRLRAGSKALRRMFATCPPFFRRGKSQ